jgi:hypothetical protein
MLTSEPLRQEACLRKERLFQKEQRMDLQQRFSPSTTWVSDQHFAAPADVPELAQAQGLVRHKRSRRRLWLIIVGILFFVLAGGSLVYFLSPSRVTQETHTFMLGSHPKLILQITAGSLHVQSNGPDNRLTIVAVEHVKEIGSLSHPSVTYQQSSDGNMVNVRVQGRTIVGLTALDFEVTAPRGCDLQLETRFGSITVVVPGSEAFHVEMTGGLGSISSDFPEVQVHGLAASGDVGDTTRATITLHTLIGLLRLEKGAEP